MINPKVSDLMPGNSLPLVSVIIPTYNNAKYLRECIESVLNQSYGNLEIIVVDDGSDDETKNIAADYPKINYLFQTNKGLANARNTAIKKSCGKYVFFLDSDDILLKDSISELVCETSKDNSIDVVYGKAVHFRENSSQQFHIKHEYHEKFIFYDLLGYGNFIAIGTALVKMQVFDKYMFSDRFRRFEDLDFWLRLSYGGLNFKYLDRFLAKIRIHRSSLSSDLRAMNLTRLKVLQDMEKKCMGDNIAKSAVFLAQAKAELLERNYFVFFRKLIGAFYLNIKNWNKVLLQLCKIFPVMLGFYNYRE